MDSDIGFDDSSGKATVSRADLPSNSGEEKLIKVPVLRNEQVSGIVYLRIKQVNDSQPLSSSQHVYQNVSSSQYPQQQFPQQNYPQYPQQPQQQPVSSSYNAPYNTSQQPYNPTQSAPYMQNQYTQGPPMANQPFHPSTQPQYQPNQPQSNTNYYSNQYERRY